MNIQITESSQDFKLIVLALPELYSVREKKCTTQREAIESYINEIKSITRRQCNLQ